MKIKILSICFFIYLVVGFITFLITNHFQIGPPQLGFIVGATSCSSLGSMMHYNQEGAVNNLKAKLVLGVTLSIASIILSLTLHQIYSPFKFLDVTLIISAIGSLIFPFVLFNTMWNAMEKQKTGA